jgi:FAD/FMN-containing dehydrogenase
VTVDPERRTARVEGGALLRQLDEAAQQFGLACPVGVVGHTGVAGLTLGGGIGRLQRKYGLTIDNLLACEMVGADCQLLRANQNENPELFWGLRGAGANFGVVTSFEFQLNPAGPGVMRGLLLYPLSRAREVAAIYREFTAQAPDELFITLAFGQPGALASSEGLAVFIGVMHCGPAADAERDLKALRATRPLADTIQPMTYLATQSALDEEAAWGVRSYGKGGFMPGLPDEAVAAMVEQISTAPGGGCGITLWAMGGAISRLPTEATAFSGRDAAFWIGVEASWVDATLDAAHRDWCRGAMAALQPFTGAGRYVNDVVETGADVVRAIYGPAKYERLVALKRRYDPENVFKLNQNIEP